MSVMLLGKEGTSITKLRQKIVEKTKKEKNTKEAHNPHKLDNSCQGSYSM